MLVEKPSGILLKIAIYDACSTVEGFSVYKYLQKPACQFVPISRP